MENYLDGATKKHVNLNASYPVTDLALPRVGRMSNITLTVEEIRRCLFAKATVEEIIGTKTLPLDFSNYNTDNSNAFGAKEVATQATVEPTNPTQVTEDATVAAQKAAADALAAEEAKKEAEKKAADEAAAKAAADAAAKEQQEKAAAEEAKKVADRAATDKADTAQKTQDTEKK